jgi:hypothetical protein
MYTSKTQIPDFFIFVYGRLDICEFYDAGMLVTSLYMLN